jgi:HemY protein
VIGMVLLLTAFIVALTLGLLAQDDPGYVLISRWPYEVEISLALLLAISIFGVVGIYFLVRSILRIFRTPSDIRSWQRARQHRRADQATLSGYARLIEGDWEEAEALLIAGLGKGSTPLLQYLGAAYAAQQKGDFENRDQYLLEARSQSPEHLTAIEITRARLLERAGQIDEARGVLEDLYEQGIRHGAVQMMLIDALRQQADWPALEKIMQKNRDMKQLTHMERVSLRQEIQMHRLTGHDDPQTTWRRLDRRDRKNPVLQAAHVRALIDTGQFDIAEKFLRKCINRKWDGELVRLYGCVRSERIDEQLQRAEQWRLGRQDDPNLLMTLARLNIENSNRQKAKELVLKAIQMGGTKESYLELGLLLESLGESDKALQCYRRGLQIEETNRLNKMPSGLPVKTGELVPVISSSAR